MPSRMMAGVASSSSASSSVDSPPSDSISDSRRSRNLAEKQRRDKLNGYISELATIVPMVSMTTKRLDKTSILRLSAAHLRIYHSSLNPNKNKKKFSWGPEILNYDHLNELLKAAGGFLLIASHTGKILYVSSSVENYLGQQNIEMIGHSLFSFVHPSDVTYVQEKLKSLALLSAQRKKPSARCTFSARMRERSQPRSETLNHQLMQFSCSLDVDEENGISHKAKSINLKRNKCSYMDSLSGSILKVFIKPLSPNPFNELSVTEAFQDEYITRHGIDGKILFADHRISTITGHLPHEVLGMSAYEYICDKDIPVAIFAHNRMFSSSDGVGYIVYRLRTRNQTAVYLKSTGHLQYEKSSTQVHHFMCINKLLSEKEGETELNKFIEQHTPHVHEESSSTLHPLLSSLKPVQVSKLLEAIPSKETLPVIAQPFISSTESAMNAMTVSKSTPYSTEPSVDESSTVNLLTSQQSNTHLKYQSDEMDYISASHTRFSSEASHSPNETFDQDNSELNYLTLETPVNRESTSECYGMVCGKFEQQTLDVLHSTQVDSTIAFPSRVNGRKRLAESFSGNLDSMDQIGSPREVKRKYQRLNIVSRKQESNVFSHREETVSVNDARAYQNGFRLCEFEEDCLPTDLFDPGIQSDMYKTNQGALCLEEPAVECHNNFPYLISDKELNRIADNSTECNALEDVDMGWNPCKSSFAYSTSEEIDNPLQTHCDNYEMPSSRYSTESNSVLQSYGVDSSEEQFDGSYNCLNVVKGK